MAALPRRTGLVSVAALAGIALTICVVQLVAPETARAAGLDVWNLGTEERDCQRVEQYRDELELSHTHLIRQIEVSDQVVGRLVESATPLSDGVDELEEINRGRIGFEDGLAATYPEAPTYRLRVARYALRKALEQLSGDPSRRAAVSTRLEGEYRAMTAAR